MDATRTTKDEGRALDRCPACGCREFGKSSGEPVTTGGWYGNARFTWGRYAGVHTACLTGQRCPECGHVHAVDPDWD